MKFKLREPPKLPMLTFRSQNVINCGENHQENCVSTTTTADCKTFLASQFAFEPKGWKRVSKFNDSEGNATREFSHPESQDNIFLVERNGQLELTDHTARSALNSKKCSKYTFCVTDDKVPGGHTVMIASDDEDMAGEHDPVVPTLFPKDWEVECEMEEVFSIYTTLSEDELIVALHDMGFKSDADYDENCSGRSALTSPTILARKQKKVLNKAVQTNSAPTSSPSKI